MKTSPIKKWMDLLNYLSWEGNTNWDVVAPEVQRDKYYQARKWFVEQQQYMSEDHVEAFKDFYFDEYHTALFNAKTNHKYIIKDAAKAVLLALYKKDMAWQKN